MRYTAHTAYVAPAQARSGLGWLLLGFLLACSICVLWVIALFGSVFLTAGVEGGQTWLDRMTRADTPTSTLLVLATLWGLAVGVMVVAPLIHRRSAWTLFGPWRRMRRQFVIATLVCAAVLATSALIPFGYDPLPGLDLPLWLNFLPLSLLVILGQTGAEELFFRGYLQQQLAARFNTPFVWMGVPSILFGLAHLDPSNGPVVAWLIVGATGLFGLCAADLTARTGTIGAAWGFHFANNVTAILIVSLGGPMSGLALFVTPFGAADTETLVPLLLRDMATTAAIWAAIRFALAKTAR